MYLIGYEEVSVGLELFSERRHDGFVTYQIQRLEGSGKQNKWLWIPLLCHYHSRNENEDWCQWECILRDISVVLP